MTDRFFYTITCTLPGKYSITRKKTSLQKVPDLLLKPN